MPPWIAALRRTLARQFSIDIRSLAAFRVFLGALVVVDVAARARWLSDYSDGGILPLADYLLSPAPFGLQVHQLSGAQRYIAALFGLHLLAALAFTFGCYTRLAALVCWWLTESLQARNGYLLDGGDIVLRNVLFLAMFLPAGEAWSFDAWRKARHGIAAPPRALLSVAGAALLLQFVYVYVVAGVLKTGPAWHAEGSAVELVLRDAYWVRPLGTRLAVYSDLLGRLTPAVYWFECLGPLLMFSPWWTWRVRLFGVLCFIAFQASLWLCIQLHLFSWIATSLLLPFVPAEFWNWLSRRGANVDELGANRSPLGAMPAANVCVATFAGYALLQNLGHVPGVAFPPVFYRPAAWLGLEQNWGMYAPEPTRYTHSLTLSATTEAGDVVNLLRRAESPAGFHRVVRRHAEYRFRYYMERDKSQAGYFTYLTWLCNSWNALPGVAPLNEVTYTRYLTPILLGVASETAVPVRQGWLTWRCGNGQ